MPYKKTVTSSADDFVGKPTDSTPMEEPVKQAKNEDTAASVQQEESRVMNQESREGTDSSPVSGDVQTDNRESASSQQAPRNDDLPQSQQQSSGYHGRYHHQQRNYSNDLTQGPTEEVKGILDVQPEGHGFLRPKFLPSNKDIYISQSQIRRFSLRPGDAVAGIARPPKDNERYYGLLKVEKVNEVVAEESLKRPYFDDLTPIYPNKQVALTTGKFPFSTRIIDLIAPIGFGQRGMIVSPPKAGKTTIMKEIAAGITANYPQAHLMAALIGERPEEVTDISMSVKGDVIASNFDEAPEHQTKVAEITLERAKRLVEMGKDVIILLDSITRLARAYNLSVAPSGRTLSGGFDPAALWPAKKFFGAARNCQEGGSLTIIGTALVETGSRLDDLVYEEFKGTGNMELHLDRKLAEKRIFPAINIKRSGTREEGRLFDPETLRKIATMHRMLTMLPEDEATDIMIQQLERNETNVDFLANLGKQ